jgi:hypothetical protein
VSVTPNCELRGVSELAAVSPTAGRMSYSTGLDSVEPPLLVKMIL